MESPGNEAKKSFVPYPQYFSHQKCLPRMNNMIEKYEIIVPKDQKSFKIYDASRNIGRHISN
jgi:hypothetical protein